MQLIVLGMHRSGTSAVTRLLNMAGAYFGPEGIATEANDENPKGFWERRDLRGVCDALLHGSGADWWNASAFTVDSIPNEVLDEQVIVLRRLVLELDAHRPWVLKEPRLCLLLPVLRPLLEVPIAVHVVRDPIEIAQSLARRNGFPVTAGVALWELYAVRSLEASAGMPSVLVRYDELMADPARTVARLVTELESLGVAGLRTPTEREVDAFIEVELHRQRSNASARPGWLNASQNALLAALESGAALIDPQEFSVSAAALDTLGAFEQSIQVATERDEVATQATRLADQAARSAEQADREAARAQRQEARGNQHRDRAAREAARADEAVARAAATSAAGKLAVADASAKAARLEATVDERDRRIESAEAELKEAEYKLRLLSRSGTWRAAWKLIETKGRLTRRRVAGPGPLRRGIDGVARARVALRTPSILEVAVPPDGSDSVSPTEEPPPAARSLDLPYPRPRTSDRPKVAVLAWDVGHNPLGRAYILAELLGRHAEVEIWGAQFDRYGSAVWAPMRGGEVPILSFPGLMFPEHIEVLEQVASRIDADALWVAKPRLPSYALGILAKAARNRPLVVDVDDHELAFFGEDAGLDLRQLESLRGDPDLALPFGRAWTMACDPLIAEADAVTVSNPSLQDRYGGSIVPHARDERLFDPARFDRREIRRQLGFGDEHRLLLFGGTPRIHKGAVEVLQALDRLGDDRYRVLMFGTRELDDLKADLEPLKHWAAPLPYTPFTDLPSLVVAADLACVLQDATHPVARYQLPAKITDALAMEVPCLVRPVPPLQSFIDDRIVDVFSDDQPLHERIRELFDNPDQMRDTAARGREAFLDRFSYAAVGPVVAEMFEGLIDKGTPPVSSALIDLADAPRRMTAPLGSKAASPTATLLPKRRPGQKRRPLVAEEPYDIVMFWKQNDSGIYGRRQDMFLKYLERSRRVGRIVHFDSPITPEALVKTYKGGRGNASDQSTLVVRQTVRRLLHRQDEPRVTRRTYLYGGKQSTRLGLPVRSGYSNFVRTELDRLGIGSRPTVFWAFPTNDDLPGLTDAFDPDVVVADVVDDNRTWYDRGTAGFDRVEKNYAEVLERSDVVLANCAPVAEAMRFFTPEVHLIPNGCELPDGNGAGPRPSEFAGITGPVIGYVGNLSARIDIPLLDALARARPGWTFVFIGSAHLDRTILDLESHHNVRFLGVRPYEETRRLVRHFDVALIPHVDNEMTRSMHPLKAFVYCSAGVPVVSTPIANLEELSPLITQASGVDGFLTAIDIALAQGHSPPNLDLLRPHSWEVRVEHALDLVDLAFGGRSPR